MSKRHDLVSKILKSSFIFAALTCLKDCVYNIVNFVFKLSDGRLIILMRKLAFRGVDAYETLLKERVDTESWRSSDLRE